MSVKLPAVCTLALTLALAHGASAEDLGNYQNGDVLVGTALSGADLPSGDVDKPLLVTIDTPYQVFDATGTFIHVAAWAPDGTPARNARVYLSEHLVGRTDTHGVLVFRWGVPGNDLADYWTSGSSINVRWDHQGETHGGAVWFSAFSRTQSFASDHLFVYTDRGVYNPGQTVHLRSIGWHLEADYAPLAESQIEYLLIDPSGRTVAADSVSTDRFGAAAGQLALSPHATEGMYELRASFEGETATARLRVEHFVPPTIDIEHTIGRFLTRDQQELPFEVQLGYFAGGEFLEGTISVDVLVNGDSRFHDDREVTGAGPHAFTIDQSALDAIRRDLAENQRLEVQLRVEDGYGRSDDLKRELRYTANPYITIIEKDRDYYSTGDPVELVVRITDRDRVPVRDTELRLVTSEGQEVTATSDDGGTAQFSLVQTEGGFSVDVFIAGVDVAVASDYIPWQELQPMRSHISTVIVEEAQPTEIRVTFPADFIPAESVVHVDVVDTSGSLVNAVLVPVTHDGERYVAEGSFIAPSWGSMLLTLFCLGSDGSDVVGSEVATNLGLMTEGQQMVVHPGRQLEIHLDGVADSAAPGSHVAGTIRVTDADGNPVEAVIGAALVDESVISLKDPLEITPMDHFYNPELRTISTTGSAILTWPVVTRNWGGRTHDVALPPFPYLAGGAIAAVPARGDLADAVMDGDDLEEEEMMQYASGMGAAGIQAQMQLGAIGSPSPDAPAPPAQPAAIMMDGSMEPAREEADERVAREAVEPVTITIRTSFPETAMWEPFIYTEGGRASLSAGLPDAITRQQFTLVASDANGGVGVLRHSLTVTQPLFVQADLPDALIAGDQVDARVLVQNLGEAPQTVELTLNSDQLTVHGGARTIEVAPGAVGFATFQVTATEVGRFEFEATASGSAHRDTERRSVWVRPAGEPVVSLQQGRLTADHAFTAAMSLSDTDQFTTVTLNVAFPAVSAAFAGLDAIHERMVSSDLLSLGGEVIATALLYQYLQEMGGGETERAKMRSALDAYLPLLLSAQRPDGGWGLWWHKQSSPYLTGYCLEALSTLDSAGFDVPTDAMERAVRYLSDALSDGTWDMGTISFWEGNTDAVQLGLTGEIFSVLAGLPDEVHNPIWQRLVTRLGSRFIEYLDDESPDVLTLAHAVLGLHRLRDSGLVAADESRLLTAARHLTTVRRDAHWEPSWFNAYGGTIEATVTVLQVLDELGGDLLAADMRDTVRYLLSTRNEWGGWHNPRGTAAAVRGLLILGVGQTESATDVQVVIDGEVVRTVAIDPSDPFLSAAELRALDLTQYVGPGEHTLEVRYGGRLDPDVSVITTRWPATTAMHSTVSLEASLPRATTQVGGIVDYTLAVRSETNSAQLVAVDIAVPGNARLDRPTVADIEERGLIESHEWTPEGLRLYVHLDGEASRELTFRLVAERKGEAHVPAVVARALSGETRAVAVVAEQLVVE